MPFTLHQRVIPKPKRLFYVGSEVVHLTYGRGVIIEEWGSWTSCNECHRPLTDKCTCNAPYSGVGGAGTFDVLFRDGKQRSINKVWLKSLGDLPNGTELPTLGQQREELISTR